MDALLHALNNNQPELFREFQATPEDIEGARRKYALPPGQLPLLSVRGPLVRRAVEQFGRKLFLALFYKHADRIVPPEGGVAIRWYTNLQVDNGEIPAELQTIVPGRPELARNAKPIHDQFTYRYGIAEGRAAVFLAGFRKSFAILGYVHMERSEMGTPAADDAMPPFSFYSEQSHEPARSR